MSAAVTRSQLAGAKRRYLAEQTPSPAEGRRQRNRQNRGVRTVRRNNRPPKPENVMRLPPPEHLAELWDAYFRLSERGDAGRHDVLDSIIAHVAVFGPLQYHRDGFFRTGHL